MCTISVIVPVYKVEPYISRCVDSILNQTFTDFELVLVDDGSPDKCGKMCDEYAKKDNRIHVIHKKNGGLSDARNAGIDWCFENSNSEWITFIDSDDWVHPRYLEFLYNATQKYNSSISVCSYTRVEDFIPFVDISDFDISYMNTEQLFLEHNIEATVAWAKLYQKEYFKTVRYPFGRIHEDEFVTYRLLFQNNKISFVNLPLYFYYNNPKSIMNSKWSLKNLDAIVALRQQCDFFKKKGNNKLFVVALKKYIWALETQYTNLIDYDDYINKNKLIKHIRSELRKCLRNKGVDMTVSQNTQIYTIAYPKMINVFYFYKKLKKKINRIRKRILKK